LRRFLGAEGENPVKEPVEFSGYQNDWEPRCPECRTLVSMSISADEIHQLPPSERASAMASFCD